uniref:Uncharacterized protein n=1 Tax=Arundo donax TaxID=35708 RepID=A0A0A9D594_ARUDO
MIESTCARLHILPNMLTYFRFLQLIDKLAVLSSIHSRGYWIDRLLLEVSCSNSPRSFCR